MLRRSLFAALPAALLLVGCPSGGGQGEVRTAGIRIDFDAEAPPRVGDELQLHLKFQGNAGKLMTGALIKPEQSVAEWSVDPAGAAEVDAASRVKFLKSGRVSLHATYRQQGQLLKSKPVAFQVAEGDVGGGVAPVETATQPAAEAAPGE
jgi:hypothetical protein